MDVQGVGADYRRPGGGLITDAIAIIRNFSFPLRVWRSEAHFWRLGQNSVIMTSRLMRSFIGSGYHRQVYVSFFMLVFTAGKLLLVWSGL